MRRTHPIDIAAVQAMFDYFKGLYREFPWESQVWEQNGVRRSPYRALILFGLSARTKDRLLVRNCGGFFRRFPQPEGLLAGWPDEALDCIVRAGQVPFLESAVQVIGNHGGAIPPDKNGLREIKGVGEKIAECVVAYGRGGEALPLDGNGCRVVERVCGPITGAASGRVQFLRSSLKALYHSHRPWMESRGLAMIDLHEMLRLHGQVVCTKAPKCSRCAVPTCRSRRQEYQTNTTPPVSPAIWRDWRELLLEPEPVKGY